MSSDEEIETVDDLKQFLYLALRIEHATLPPYLTALYSIMPGTNQDSVQILRVIAVEEMLHLTFAANLMNAIGGEPDLSRRKFVPSYPTALPGGTGDFKIDLEPFSPHALDTFLDIERPKMAGDQPPIKQHQYVEGARSFLGVHPKDSSRSFSSIGEFYAFIERGFKRLEERARAENKTIFIGKVERQVGPEQFYSGGGKLFKVTDLRTACLAIEKVIEQGEGELRRIRDDQGELAHYYRFEQIKSGTYYQPTDDTPGAPTGPTFEVDWKSVYPIAKNVKLEQMRGAPELYEAAVAFNRGYAAFLDLLTQAYNGQPTLLEKAVHHMFQIRNLMNQLIRNPLPGSAEHAGPTFELYP